ncbi:MAG: ASPIC/UnbV domain-containing protein [Akkermansiaceae bacterium]
MSQSPLDSAGRTGNLQSYRQGWKALNRLLHENKSFSGRETNNGFLNCRDGRFADISSAIGWDFADDARAIAQVDWDHDGDLDYWVTNRTAPRLRLLENTLDSQNHFLSVLLVGNGQTTNADAIGARITLTMKGSSQPHIRTLHAGHSFLSQETRWLHFGLGKANEIASLSVAWPGGEKEIFTGLASDHFYTLRQGSGAAEKANFAQEKVNFQLTTTPIQSPSPLTRTIPMAGQYLPEVILKSGPLTLEKTSLIQLWSHTCPHCLSLLPKWKMEPDTILISANTGEGESEACTAAFRKAGISETPHIATSGTMETLDSFQSSLLDLWSPLPVPSSFLVTREGEVLAVYRGSVSADQLSKDRQLAGEKDRRSASIPFPGKWLGDPPTSDPQRTASQLIERGAVKEAIRYLQTTVKHLDSKKDRFAAADSFFLLGRLLGQNGRSPEALEPLQKAYALIPNDSRIGLLLSQALIDLKRQPEALEVNAGILSHHPANLDLLNQRAGTLEQLHEWQHLIPTYERIAEITPESPDPKLRMAYAFLMIGDPKAAIAKYKEILGKHPRTLIAADQLAKVLASHPVESVRSGEEAVLLSQRLCKLTKNENPGFLLTRAIALANVGKYPEAITITDTLISKLPENNSLRKDASLVAEVIKKSQPYRNSLWPTEVK